MSLSCIHDDSDQLTMTFKMTPCCVTQPAALKALGNRDTCERLRTISLKYDLQENTFNYKVALITVAFVNVLFFCPASFILCVFHNWNIVSRLSVKSALRDNLYHLGEMQTEPTFSRGAANKEKFFPPLQ